MELQDARTSGERAKDGFDFQRQASASRSAVSEERPSDDSGNDDASGLKSGVATPSTQFSTPPARPSDGYTDGRKLWDWKSKYDPEARLGIAYEAKRLLAYLGLSLALAAFSLMLSDQEIRIPLPFKAVSADGNP